MSEERKKFIEIVEDFKKRHEVYSELNNDTVEKSEKMLKILMNEAISDEEAMDKSVNVIISEALKEKSNDKELNPVFDAISDGDSILNKIKKSELN